MQNSIGNIHNVERKTTMVAVYSGAHFLVDFACAFLMFRFIAGTPEGYFCVLLYNFCAFAMQMPLGLAADKWNRNFLFAIIGCLLVGLAFGFVTIPVFAVIVVGIGNAMFHLGGGLDVLNVSEQKLGALGVFVSPGAFGIYLGTLLGRENSFSAIFFPILLLAAAGLIIISYRSQRGTYPGNAAFSLEGVRGRGIVAAAVFLFLVVCLRSYVGLSMNFPWKGEWHLALALVLAVVFGKTAGGFAADRFGLGKTSVFSLGIAAFLFLFSHVPMAGVTAALLFNMTMPVTLWAMAKILPGAKGFAFGLLTFGLFLGFIPVYLDASIPRELLWLFALLSVGSLALLLLGLRMAKQYTGRTKG
jgi:FSR family fosmidomycin resistance protein-like MFS transporter